MRKRSLSQIFSNETNFCVFQRNMTNVGLLVRLAKNHISALNVNTSEAIATDLMGISLLKESLLCVKFYNHEIDSISVFGMKLKRILISAKGYRGEESLTTIIDKITWTNSEFKT